VIVVTSELLFVPVVGEEEEEGGDGGGAVSRDLALVVPGGALAMQVVVGGLEWLHDRSPRGSEIGS
jgi:hypothetical protein